MDLGWVQSRRSFNVITRRQTHFLLTICVGGPGKSLVAMHVEYDFLFLASSQIGRRSILTLLALRVLNWKRTGSHGDNNGGGPMEGQYKWSKCSKQHHIILYLSCCTSGIQSFGHSNLWSCLCRELIALRDFPMCFCAGFVRASLVSDRNVRIPQWPQWNARVLFQKGEP